MYAIYGNIYHQYTPFMLSYIAYMDPMGDVTMLLHRENLHTCPFSQYVALRLKDSPDRAQWPAIGTMIRLDPPGES